MASLSVGRVVGAALARGLFGLAVVSSAVAARAPRVTSAGNAGAAGCRE
ncbi:MAG: hypothetical protein KF894_20875 [Labilithrix sp.]|nr:hypothetical protein [Labilithrix sp.]